MRLFVTGGTGFVGSNIIKVATERHAADVATTAYAWRSPEPQPFEVVRLDMTDATALRRAALDAKPDAIIHAAILNDFGRMYADRALAWDSYVTSTRTLVDVANDLGARIVLVSTDWVFDGTQAPSTEATPPNPINIYGLLKVIAETVVTNVALRGSIARIAGVNGTHWLDPSYAASQNPGLGHFAGAVLDALEAGQRFDVWEGELNMVGTPSLASESAEMILRIIERDRSGVFHCSGGESVSRMELARAVTRAFDLDEGLLDIGPADFSGTGPARIPLDTRLDASATAAALDYRLPGLDAQLATFRHERIHGTLAAAS